MLPQEFIDEVKSSVNMLELASRYTDLKKIGDGIYGGRCPNPEHRDSNPSFTVFEKDQSWCCYGCHQGNKYRGKTHSDTNYGSDCFAFMQWITQGKLNWRQAILKLAEENDILLPDDENSALYKTNFNLAYSYTLNLKGEPLKYLQDRGFTLLDCQKWMIGFDGVKITFPLLDRYKRVLGFTRRWLHMPENCRDKYRNSKTSDIFNKSFYFYGMHLFDPSYDYIYITEGPVDVILGNKYGLTNTVATLGTSFTESHAEVIKKLKKTPVFIMDGDDAGMKSAKKSIDKLADIGVYSKIVILPDSKDLADLAFMLKDDLKAYIEKRTFTYGFYKVQHIANEYDSKLNELRLALLPELKEVLESIPGDERKVITDYIYDKLRLNFKEGIQDE